MIFLKNNLVGRSFLYDFFRINVLGARVYRVPFVALEISGILGECSISHVLWKCNIRWISSIFLPVTGRDNFKATSLSSDVYRNVSEVWRFMLLLLQPPINMINLLIID